MDDTQENSPFPSRSRTFAGRADLAKSPSVPASQQHEQTGSKSSHLWVRSWFGGPRKGSDPEVRCRWSTRKHEGTLPNTVRDGVAVYSREPSKTSTVLTQNMESAVTPISDFHVPLATFHSTIHSNGSHIARTFHTAVHSTQACADKGRQTTRHHRNVHHDANSTIHMNATIHCHALRRHDRSQGAEGAEAWTSNDVESCREDSVGCSHRCRRSGVRVGGASQTSWFCTIRWFETAPCRRTTKKRSVQYKCQ